jgi:hypothetical protein
MKNDLIQIVVQDIINSDTAVSAEDGDLVFNEIDKAFSKNQKVELDFSGIHILITAFLNAAIGQLYSKYRGQELNKKLTLKNVANEDKVQFFEVVKRAKEYFANKKDFEDSANNAFYDK